MKDKVKMVTIKGGKQGQDDETVSVSKDDAVLILNGNVFRLDSFVLCGTSIEEGEPDRVIMTWNSSVDEMVVYNRSLTLKIDDKLRESLGGYNQDEKMSQIEIIRRLDKIEARQKMITERLEKVENGHNET